jgi:diguanylate cyclase (GGDEF)-like protein/PAS domain S-box-containing protein
MPRSFKDSSTAAARDREHRVSEARYRRLFETARDGILLINAETAQIDDVNPYLIEMLGYSHAEFLGKKLWEVGPFVDIPLSKEMFEKLKAAGYVRYDNLPLKTKTGLKIDVEFVSNSYDCEGIKVIQCNIRNITDRKIAEALASQHTRLYAALSQCNQTIVRCTTEAELFPEICRIAVELGGVKMAWIGFVDADKKSVRPVASWGDDHGYLKDIHISVADDTPFGQGPVARAIRTNQAVWLQDLMHDPAIIPWRDRMALSNWVTLAALPIGDAGTVSGIFNVYSDKLAFFDEPSRDLLCQLAADISFALRGFAREAHRKRSEDALRKSEDEFHTLAEAVPQIVWVTGRDGSNIYFNQRWADYTGLAIEASHGTEWLGQFHPDEQQHIRDAWRLATEGNNSFSRENRLRDADGIYRWFLVQGVPLRDGAGDVIKWFGTCTDIDDLKTAEIKIGRLNRVYAVLSRINALIIRAKDREELFSEACRIAVQSGGFRMSMMCLVDQGTMKISPVASMGKDEVLLAMVEGALESPEDAANTMSGRAIREKGAIVSQDMLKDPNAVFGREYAGRGVRSVAVFPVIVSDKVEGIFSLFAEDVDFFDKEEMVLLIELVGDIAFAIDHISKGEQLSHLAYYDALTGLANRRLFLERVGQSIRGEASHRRKIAVLLINLNRFKNINDSLGRAAGDALLKQVAAWLAESWGDANLIARLGVDHFGVVLPDVAPGRDLVRILENMLKALAEHPFRLNDTVIRVSAVVGAALYPNNGIDAEALFKHAEAALKSAKARGSRYLFYTSDMTSAMEGKLSLETQLREALEKEQFVLHYQPKINLASGKITGAEALIRWNDPRVGLVPPGQFIPILEETGLIVDVGNWALANAMKDYLRWRDAGLPTGRIAVNVSPIELRDPGFIAKLEQIVRMDGRAAAGLELEITEGVIMEDIATSIATLGAIRAMGITIAIDDFGTGFSSLSYLAKLPVDALKIDRSFIVEMTHGPEGLTLVNTIIALAHGLNLMVVAEGVETDEQFRLLRLLGCNEMQGFFFSKPIPAELFEARYLLQAHDFDEVGNHSIDAGPSAAPAKPERARRPESPARHP